MSSGNTAEKSIADRKYETTILDDVVPPSLSKSPTQSERASFLSVISKSRLFSEGPSERSRALVFALAVLMVTITCLVFLLGVRVIRGDNQERWDPDLGRMLEILGLDNHATVGYLNVSVDIARVNTSNDAT